MKLVETIENIEKNIKTLERDKEKSSKFKTEYIKLLGNGKCYLPYLSEGIISFIPSRFIGYINNNLANHMKNPNRDGGLTNKAISKLLLTNPQSNDFLEEKFILFCESQGAKPSKKIRRYWIHQEIENIVVENEIDKISKDPEIEETEKLQLIKSRIGQGDFRKELIKYWGKCCISQSDLTKILRASHIKPWKDSNHKERLNKFNGLLLTPNFDALFDNGLISFDGKGKILISKLLSNDQCKTYGIHEEIKIKLEKEHLKFMKWHQKEKFIDNIVS